MPCGRDIPNGTICPLRGRERGIYIISQSKQSEGCDKSEFIRMKKRAFIYVIAAGILWGTSGIFVHNLAPFCYSSLQMTAMRGGVALVLLLLYAIVRDRSAFRVNLRELCIFALTGLALFGTGSCYFLSMQKSTISTAVVLMYMAPVYVAVWSVLFFSEKMSKLKITAIMCMLVGCVLVSGVIGGISYDGFGIFMGVLSGISYGAYNILTKISMRRGSSAISATIYSTLFMTALAFAVASPYELFEITQGKPAQTLPWIVGVGVVTFVLPYLLFTLAMKELPAGTASSLSVVEPMSATIFGVVLFKEKLGALSACGIILIFLAVILLGKTEIKETEK